MLGSNRGFSGMADSIKPCTMLWADPCCHGNDIWPRRGDLVAYRFLYCFLATLQVKQHLPAMVTSLQSVPCSKMYVGLLQEAQQPGLPPQRNTRQFVAWQLSISIAGTISDIITPSIVSVTPTIHVLHVIQIHTLTYDAPTRNPPRITTVQKHYIVRN